MSSVRGTSDKLDDSPETLVIGLPMPGELHDTEVEQLSSSDDNSSGSVIGLIFEVEGAFPGVIGGVGVCCAETRSVSITVSSYMH